MSKPRVGRQFMLVSTFLLLLAFALTALSSCGGSSAHVTMRPKPTFTIPKDPAPVSVVAGQATTLDLGDGAHLIIPPDAMTAGATVRATYQGQPAGSWAGIAPTFAPVELITDPPNAIHGLLTLEFPVDPSSIEPGVDPVVQFGISTYNDSTKTWTPVNSTYDPDRHMVVALIQHFSWWNPFTWDFGALFTSVVQGFGPLVNTREGPASCTSARPDWVASLAGITNDAGVAIRSCAQAQGDILDVQLVNNRPYSQILTYGSDVKWGWHQPEASLSDSLRDQSMDGVMSPYELFLPALGHASVGIFKPSSRRGQDFVIAPTPLTFSTDLLYYMLGNVVDILPLAGTKCVTAIVNGKSPLRDFSLGTLRDDIVALAECAEQSFWDLVKIGALDSWKADRLAALLGKLKRASLVANGIEFAGGVVWKIGDYLADWQQNHSALGNGFTVYAKIEQPTPTLAPLPTVTPEPNPPTATPTPPPTATPTLPPTATPTPTQPPQLTTWTEQEGSYGANSFSNPHNASGIGPHLDAMAYVQVSCKLYDPYIASVNPDGYWYRIASAPWNNTYYIAANTFWNGDIPGVKPYTHNTDWNVRNC